MNQSQERHQQCQDQNAGAEFGVWIGPQRIATEGELFDQVDTHGSGDNVDEVGDGLQGRMYLEESWSFETGTDQDTS